MFICGECLRQFLNHGFHQSVGRCEMCGRTRSCVDIPSRDLQEKPSNADDLQQRADRIYTEMTTMKIQSKVKAGPVWGGNPGEGDIKTKRSA